MTREEILSDIVGMKEADVKTFLKRKGLVPRVMNRDGESLVGLCDVNADRINLSIKDGIVVSGYIG